jgi:hypothetical protein
VGRQICQATVAGILGDGQLNCVAPLTQHEVVGLDVVLEAVADALGPSATDRFTSWARS